MAEIPVENGTLIELDCAFSEYAGDPATDTDCVTITIQVQGESAVSTPESGQTGGVTLAPEVTLKGDTATATVTESAVNEAIAAVKKDGAGAIIIAPKPADGVTGITVELPKTAAKSIVSETSVSLNIETAVGMVSIPNDALSSITAQAAGSDIAITVTQKTAADVKDKTIDTS